MDNFILDLGIISAWASIFAYLAFLLKQPIIVAYVLCGFLAGPWGLNVIKDTSLLAVISRIGITLLLFLAGDVLHPRHLKNLFKKTAIVTLGSAGLCFGSVFGFLKLFGFSSSDTFFISLALIFSSTILVIKLLPTTKLHHAKIGEISIGILVFQDLIAVLSLVFIQGLFSSSQGLWADLGFILLKFFGLMVFVFLFEQFVLRKILAQVDRFQEMIFILALAWCFGVAALAKILGLSFEIGAFFAGVALARHPISLFISEKLKPIRDFFLVLFFFVLGAQIHIGLIKDTLWIALGLAVFICLLKPLFFMAFFRAAGEEKRLINETSWRMGQCSEFALLIAIMALDTGKINPQISQFIQISAIFTMIISTYLVIFFYPTPIGIQEKLHKD